VLQVAVDFELGIERRVCAEELAIGASARRLLGGQHLGEPVGCSVGFRLFVEGLIHDALLIVRVVRP
jgi:hypothetical protein